jgi:hypothetical protein
VVSQAPQKVEAGPLRAISRGAKEKAPETFISGARFQVML